MKVKTTKKGKEVMTTSQKVVTLEEEEGVIIGMGQVGGTLVSFVVNFFTWGRGYKATHLIIIYPALRLMCVDFCIGFPFPSLPHPKHVYLHEMENLTFLACQVHRDLPVP